MNLFLLAFVLAFLNPSEDKLTGDWVPLYYEDTDNLDCHLRYFEEPLTVSFKNGVLSFDYCNHISYYYEIDNNVISLKPVSLARTDLYCTDLVGDIENELGKGTSFSFWANDDTMIINLNERGKLKLVRSEKFNVSWYHDYYKEKGCKWPNSDNVAHDSINNEPVHYSPEVPAELDGDSEVQKFINDHIVRTPGMEERGINRKISALVTIDSKGALKSFKTTKSCGPCDVEISKILKKMPAWRPALIDDKPVNSVRILVFDYRIK